MAEAYRRQPDDTVFTPHGIQHVFRIRFADMGVWNVKLVERGLAIAGIHHRQQSKRHHAR